MQMSDLRLKCTKFDFGWPDPAGGAYSAPPDRLAGFKGGLALLFVHPDITLDYDAVIDEFGKSNRRLQFC